MLTSTFKKSPSTARVALWRPLLFVAGLKECVDRFLWSARAPRLEYQLFEILETDLLEPHEHRGITIEVRRREVDAGLARDERFLHLESRRANAQDRTFRSARAERFKV